MAKCFIQDSTLTAIGDAIRAKTGGTDLMLPSAMPAAIEGIVSGGGSGSYVWTKQGMSETVTEDTTGGTYTLTTADDSRPSSEIEYASAAPTYDSAKRQWVFTNPTVVTIVNSNDTLPVISGNVYCRVTSEPNVWYLVTSFNKGSSSPYLKSMAYSKKITATADPVAKRYLTDKAEDKYPEDGWLDGYYYKRIVADPNRTGGGDEWTQSNVTSGIFSFVHYANDIWVACSYYSGLYYSTDGKTWAQSNVTSGTFQSVYHANGIWVAGGSDIGIYYSTDGKTWTQSNVTSGTFYCVYCDNGAWVTGSKAGLYYSTDGKIWVPSNVTSGIFQSVYHANGIWVAGGSRSGIYYSTDGYTWTQSNMTSESFVSIYYDNSVWVAASTSGLYYSTDGKTWTQSNVTSGTFYCVYCDNSIWVACSYSSGLYYSTDGKTWAQSNVTSGTFQSVYHANGIWVAGGSDIGIYYSTDGKTWTQSNVTSGRFKFVCYANGVWIACSFSDTGLYYSATFLIEVDF